MSGVRRPHPAPLAEPARSRAEHRRRVRQELLALVSLLALAALTVMVIVFLVRNLAYVLLAVAGLLVALVGVWWMLTKRMPRRALGVAGMAVGLAAVVASLVASTSNGNRILVRLVVAVGLVVIAVTAGRASFVEAVGRGAEEERHVVSLSPVLICNPRSGGGKVEQFGLVDLASSLGVEAIMLEPGNDLEQLAVQAVRHGADCLGMAGGDGSQAVVASVAVQHDLPYVCVSAGTRNHFALDLGLDRDDPRACMPAYRDAIERRVDYATVNGRFFVNNVSLGVYATIVQRPEYRDAKSDTTKTLLPELLGERAEPFDLQFTAPDGSTVDDAFVIMVSNNPYVLGPALDLSQRRRMDSGHLGVFAIRATTGAQAAEIVTLALAGQPARSSHVCAFTAETFEVRSRSGRAYAGIDGEALELGTPLVFRAHRQGLRVLVPKGNLGIAARRQARDVRLHDLVSTVHGGGRPAGDRPTGERGTAD